MVVVSLSDKIAGDVYCFIHGDHSSMRGGHFCRLSFEESTSLKQKLTNLSSWSPLRSFQSPAAVNCIRVTKGSP